MRLPERAELALRRPKEACSREPAESESVQKPQRAVQKPQRAVQARGTEEEA